MFHPPTVHGGFLRQPKYKRLTLDLHRNDQGSEKPDFLPSIPESSPPRRSRFFSLFVECPSVEKCLECARYKLEIDNLEHGTKLAREDAFKGEPARKGTKDAMFQLLL
jgi:hypothetical protein